MKHTPGPWKVIKEDLTIRTDKFDVPQCGQGDYQGQIIASVDPEEWARECREDVIPTMEANARLIAAAPDLLEACKEAEVYLQYNHGQGNKAYNMCQQAIAKAEDN